MPPRNACPIPATVLSPLIVQKNKKAVVRIADSLVDRFGGLPLILFPILEKVLHGLIDSNFDTLLHDLADFLFKNRLLLFSALFLLAHLIFTSLVIFRLISSVFSCCSLHHCAYLRRILRRWAYMICSGVKPSRYIVG